MLPLATVTIGIDPFLHLGPLDIAWHGLMIAIGIAVGAALAARWAREKGLSTETLLNLVMILALAGILGARLLFLVLNEPGSLLRPGDWADSRGYAFYGALITGPLAVAVHLRRKRLTVRYLDALAAGFPLGMAVGRIGDVINGEHYGPETTLPWGFRYTHPDAEVPGSAVAYHSGGFYEVVLALAMLALLWPLRHRFRPGVLLALTIASYSAGRFVMFFFRDDAEELALGLDTAQWVSIALLFVAAGTAVRAKEGARARSAP
jgi:phosphatidylglycerol:prolipoprotein diacylglycerol transferase